MTDHDLINFLFQLVQALKYESFHDSMLGKGKIKKKKYIIINFFLVFQARFLLKRALLNRHLIGTNFFWYLQGELEGGMEDRFSLLLEVYLRACGEHRIDLLRQIEVVGKISKIGRAVKEAPANKRQEVLQHYLNTLALPSVFRLPTNPSQEVSGLLASQCKFLDSITVPLKLVFENADPLGEPISVLYKQGDDLRTDILTLKMFSLMEQVGFQFHFSFPLNKSFKLKLSSCGVIMNSISNYQFTILYY